jgi:hypothetical protein
MFVWKKKQKATLKLFFIYKANLQKAQLLTHRSMYYKRKLNPRFYL